MIDLYPQNIAVVRFATVQVWSCYRIQGVGESLVLALKFSIGNKL